MADNSYICAYLSFNKAGTSDVPCNHYPLDTSYSIGMERNLD